jgi:hypothetical protein
MPTKQWLTRLHRLPEHLNAATLPTLMASERKHTFLRLVFASLEQNQSTSNTAAKRLLKAGHRFRTTKEKPMMGVAVQRYRSMSLPVAGEQIAAGSQVCQELLNLIVRPLHPVS